MNTRLFPVLSLTLGIALASAARAQTTYPEAEPNDTKAQAVANDTASPIILESGDAITGTSISATTTGIDNFIIRTTAKPLGVYKHTLTLTSAVVGHTITVRALGQTAATAAVWPGTVGTANTTDSVAQTGATVGTARVIQWYGFGKGEKLYIRITGVSTTTSPYTATLLTEDVTPTTTAGTFQPGRIVLSSIPNAHNNDVELFVLDENLNPIPGYANDGASLNTGFTGNDFNQCQLRRFFGPGNYYVAAGNGDTMNNQGTPCDDSRRTGLILDYPNAMVCGSTTAPLNLHFTVTDGLGNTTVNTTKSAAFEIRWHKFVVAGPSFGACCRPSAACVLTHQTRCESIAGATYQGVGTTCSSCALPNSGEWQVRDVAPYARVGGAGAMVGNFFYLLSGGNASSFRGTDCWKYDVENNVWSSIAPMPASGAAAPQLGGISNINAATIGTDIYIVGGYPGSNPPLSRVLRYDTVANTWEVITSDPYPTNIYGSGMTSSGGKLYVISGATTTSTPTTACRVYDPAAPAGSRWTSLAPIGQARSYIAAVAIGTKIYAATGEPTDQDRVDVYDIPTDTWAQDVSLTAMRGGGSIYDMNGKPYAVSGGWTTFLATSEFLDAGAWTAGPNVINAMRSGAYAGNANWLVRSTGYNGSYREYTEVLRVETGATDGACCDADGACTVAPSAGACTGSFLGIGSTCSPNTCPQPQIGVCCQADGSCTVAAPGIPTASCATGSLVVDGTCTPNTCPPPPGVCCRGATCNSAVSQADCTATAPAGASFAATASCNVGGSTTSPCCYADYNKSADITVGDIFDYLNSWFAGSPFALIGGDGTSSALSVQNIFDFLNAWFAGGC